MMTQRSFHHAVVLALTVLGACAVLTVLSCRRAETPPPHSVDSRTTDSATHRIAEQPPAFTPPERSAVSRSASQDSARAELLRRKGELLMAQKRIRNSDQMTRAQKDSALCAIESESIELSKKLLEAGP